MNNIKVLSNLIEAYVTFDCSHSAAQFSTAGFFFVLITIYNYCCTCAGKSCTAMLLYFFHNCFIKWKGLTASMVNSKVATITEW